MIEATLLLRFLKRLLYYRAMDRKPDKLKVVKAFLAFLVQERSNPELGPDQVEALHVAMECLEVVYNLERHQYDPVPPNMFETTHTDCRFFQILYSVVT